MDDGVIMTRRETSTLDRLGTNIESNTSPGKNFLSQMTGTS